MCNLAQSWLKLNKLLDKYQKEERDITLIIHYNLQLDAILLDTFTSPNATARHYAAVALPKLLSFPASMVIFSSLEKSSTILRSIMHAAGNALEKDKGTSAEVEKCLASFVEHYSHLQANCPNVRRVCGVYCQNLLDATIGFMDEPTRTARCSGIEKLLETALFHTSLSEDYINFFSNKLRKTDHIQKLFSVLKNLGEKENLQHLTSFLNLLPEIFRKFLQAYPEFQPKCKKFQLLAFTQFTDGLHSDSTQNIKPRFVCLWQMLDPLEKCFRTFPNDPELLAAQKDTLSPVISKLIELHPDYPAETANCLVSIQKINHIIMENHLHTIFKSVFNAGVGNCTFLNHTFQTYSRLNQLDKLVQIITESVGELGRTKIISVPEFNSAIQDNFSTVSLSMCNKCMKLLLDRIDSEGSSYILCELLNHIICAAPVGELNNTSSQRESHLQLLTQLNELIHRHSNVKLTSSTETVFVLSLYCLLDSFFSSLFLINNLPFSRDWVMSLEFLDVTKNDRSLIPKNWGKEWKFFLSDKDEHVLKRIQEIELNILSTLARFAQTNITLPIPITSDCVLELLSYKVTHSLTTSTSPVLVSTILQYPQQILCRLNHAAKYNISQHLIHYMIDNSSEHNSITNLQHIIMSNRFKEITILHPYIAYGLAHQTLSLLDSTQEKSSSCVQELREFYLTMINRLDEPAAGDEAAYHELAISVIQLIGRNLVSMDYLEITNQEGIAKLVDLFDVLPLYYLTVDVKINLLIGLQGLMTVLGTHKEISERVTIHLTALLRGINDRIPKSGAKIKRIQEYLCTLELFTKYVHRIACENKMETNICYKLFVEISAFTFERTPNQFNSIARHTSGVWEEQFNSKSLEQPCGLLLELTRSLVSQVISTWAGFQHRNESVQRDLMMTLNTIIETSTPTLLKHINHSNNNSSLQVLAVNLKYIFLSKETDSVSPVEEAIVKIRRCALDFIREDTVDDVITLESVRYIADTLRQYNYTLNAVLEDKIKILMQPLQSLSCEVGMSDLNNVNKSGDIGSDRYLLTKRCVLALIGCTAAESNKVLISRIIDKFEKDYHYCCHLLSWMIEGNIPDTHRREIRKVFQDIISRITNYLKDGKIDGEDSLVTLRLMTAILKLPSSIGLSGRQFVGALTPLSLLALDDFTQTQEFSLLFQAKSQCLYYCLRNYPDHTTACIPAFLLLTKELIYSAFTLSNSMDPTVLIRLLECYTAHTVLSNYTYHIISKYISSAQDWSQNQATKKALKPSIFSLIGFSKPDTLLALQAQLDSTGKAYFVEMKEEYEKFYRFKGKT